MQPGSGFCHADLPRNVSLPLDLDFARSSSMFGDWAGSQSCDSEVLEGYTLNQPAGCMVQCPSAGTLIFEGRDSFPAFCLWLMGLFLKQIPINKSLLELVADSRAGNNKATLL